jgi:hypothetical protein
MCYFQTLHYFNFFSSHSHQILFMGSSFARIILQLPEDLLNLSTAAFAHFSRKLFNSGAIKMPVGLTNIEEVTSLSSRVVRLLGIYIYLFSFHVFII